MCTRKYILPLIQKCFSISNVKIVVKIGIYAKKVKVNYTQYSCVYAV
jgi:hypothetical protein